MNCTAKEIRTFKKTVWNFYTSHGRDSLLWRKKAATPYHILVSEIMLQQTQVQRVIPKYKKFLQSFPTAKKLSEASTQEVLAHWVGLGYNRRAINLQKAAQEIVTVHKNKFPKTHTELLSLPGIGPYTAGAISAFAFNQPVPILETNIRTVFIYHFFRNKEHVSEKDLMELAEKTLDKHNPKEWYWALMDYGSHLKSIHGNLSRKAKVFTKQSTFKGSIREIRGAIIRMLSQKKSTAITIKAIQKETKRTTIDIKKALSGLEKDGLVIVKNNTYTLH